MLSPDLVLSSSSTIYPLFVGTYCLLQSRKLPETGSHLRPAFNGDCTTLVCSRLHVDLIFFLVVFNRHSLLSSGRSRH